MTRRRLRWIAVQAIVVTALAVVVVLTLLRPDSQSPLSSISGGSGDPQIAQGPGSGPGTDNGGRGDDKPGGRDDDRDDEGNGSNGQSPPTGTSTGSASGSPPVTPPAAPETSPVRPDSGFETPSPSEDQYADTLGALDAAMR